MGQKSKGQDWSVPIDAEVGTLSTAEEEQDRGGGAYTKALGKAVEPVRTVMFGRNSYRSDGSAPAEG